MLDQNHYGVMEVIRNGATIWDYSVARIIRQVQKIDKELVEIIKTEDLWRITGEVFNGVEKEPYFGAILTYKGVKLLENHNTKIK